MSIQKIARFANLFAAIFCSALGVVIIIRGDVVLGLLNLTLGVLNFGLYKVNE